MGYCIAINRMALDKKLPSGDPRWTAFNDSFENKECETMDFANDIYCGRSYAAWHNGRRKVENFLCAQHIAVDMETGDERSTIDYIAGMEFVAVYGGLIYTTPSHTQEDPRARVVFFLDKPIANADAYKTAVGFIYSLFPGSDPSCVDASRFFYGSKNCQIEWLDNVLPLQHLRSYYNRFKPARNMPNETKAARAPEQSHATQETQNADLQSGIITPDKLLSYAINDASAQGRNNRGYRLACQLKELGLAKHEAESYIKKYQSSVERIGQHNYTEQEALTNLRSAYKQGMAH